MGSYAPRCLQTSLARIGPTRESRYRVKARVEAVKPRTQPRRESSRGLILPHQAARASPCDTHEAAPEDRDLLVPRRLASVLARLAREAEQRAGGLQRLRLEATFRAPGDRVTHRENLQLIGADARGLVLGRIEAIEALRRGVHGRHPQIEDHTRFGLGDTNRHFAASRRETE